MKNITIIAAIGKNNELGKDNDLIWRIPEDLKFFKENTINKPIVMGLNTFYSLPKLLPNRKHIVLSFNDVCLDPQVVVLHNIEELLNYISSLDEEIMIIGGASIYKQMINYADKMLLTQINKTADADVYFPEFSLSDWDKNEISNHMYEDIEYKHVEYIRKRID